MEETTRCPVVPWCTEGEHAVTHHKQMLGQWHTESINGHARAITVQLELWARFDLPDVRRMALTLVDSWGALPQIECELTAHQALDLAVNLEVGVGKMRA
ncbi:MAG TPA: hypothetical protein VFR23_20815 [Jiangellaceae bacterium]|nr:hypothetical protein [Jiangellaceae bacterium]